MEGTAKSGGTTTKSYFSSPLDTLREPQKSVAGSRSDRPQLHLPAPVESLGEPHKLKKIVNKKMFSSWWF